MLSLHYLILLFPLKMSRIFLFFIIVYISKHPTFLSSAIYETNYIGKKSKKKDYPASIGSFLLSFLVVPGKSEKEISTRRVN